MVNKNKQKGRANYSPSENSELEEDFSNLLMRNHSGEEDIYEQEYNSNSSENEEEYEMEEENQRASIASTTVSQTNEIYFPETNIDNSSIISAAASTLSRDSAVQRVLASKKSVIYVKCRIEGGHLRLILNTNTTQRPSRPKESGQGDHVTAYASFIAAIVNSADQESIEIVPEIIRQIGIAIMPEQENAFRDIPDPDNIVPRIVRKILTSELRNAQSNNQNSELTKISKYEPSIKSQLKAGGLAIYASVIEDLTTVFLEQIQKQPYIAFARSEEMKKGHGATVGQAIAALSFVNALYTLRSRLDSEDYDVQEKKEFIQRFYSAVSTKEYSLLKNGYLYFCDRINMETKELIQIINKTPIVELKNKLRQFRRELIPNIEIIGALFADLFDFPDRYRANKQLFSDLANRHIKVMSIAFPDLYYAFGEHEKVTNTFWEKIESNENKFVDMITKSRNNKSEIELK